ncbi:hypothetical protein TRFO_00833 [Tritrichomonas foetus]|uniref:Uncharacterized protein n=1 Tax=Tritrichomonas foetus TaxID=1144522 RepID=A0A1J4L241_9EUKA|nr:hypothetical protein TRFO_00833 [Tritrichomonas foetus]|eukprot:OHT17583.1 hypothetical protein TRFO_00833 [Tritrichomonas foetus]
MNVDYKTVNNEKLSQKMASQLDSHKKDEPCLRINFGKLFEMDFGHFLQNARDSIFIDNEKSILDGLNSLKWSLELAPNSKKSKEEQQEIFFTVIDKPAIERIFFLITDITTPEIKKNALNCLYMTFSTFEVSIDIFNQDYDICSILLNLFHQQQIVNVLRLIFEHNREYAIQVYPKCEPIFSKLNEYLILYYGSTVVNVISLFFDFDVIEFDHAKNIIIILNNFCWANITFSNTMMKLQTHNETLQAIFRLFKRLHKIEYYRFLINIGFFNKLFEEYTTVNIITEGCHVGPSDISLKIQNYLLKIILNFLSWESEDFFSFFFSLNFLGFFTQTLRNIIHPGIDLPDCFKKFSLLCKIVKKIVPISQEIRIQLIYSDFHELILANLPFFNYNFKSQLFLYLSTYSKFEIEQITILFEQFDIFSLIRDFISSGVEEEANAALDFLFIYFKRIPEKNLNDEQIEDNPFYQKLWHFMLEKQTSCAIEELCENSNEIVSQKAQFIVNMVNKQIMEMEH